MSVREMFRFNFFAIFAIQRCVFHYNSMRIRSIFNLFDFLNKVHFKFQNEFLIVNFTVKLNDQLKNNQLEIVKSLIINARCNDIKN